MQEVVLDLQTVIVGEVTSTNGTLEEVCHDFGGIICRRPLVSVRPSSTKDIALVVQYARKQGLAITCRAQGHSLGGQSLNQDGILLDMGSLNAVHCVKQAEKPFIEVDAGVTWRQVLDITLPLGLVPPVVTNYADVSVGGTHSSGGMGASSFRHGTQADNCLGLEVVTDEGEIVQCSLEENAELFRHTLGGYGQFGIISRVRHRLIRHRPTTRTYTLLYDAVDTLLDDMRTLATEGRADYMVAFPGACLQGMSHGENGLQPLIGWFFALQITTETDDPQSLEDHQYLQGLGFYKKVLIEDLPFATFIRPSMQFSRLPETANPWTDMFIGHTAAEKYISHTLRSMPSFLDVFRTPLGIFCLQNSTLQLPLIRFPEEEFIVGFGLYPTVPLSHLDLVLEQLENIGRFGLGLGGKRYLTGWLKFGAEEWQQHFGDYWPALQEIKSRYDSSNIFNPGFIPFGKQAI